MPLHYFFAFLLLIPVLCTSLFSMPIPVDEEESLSCGMAPSPIRVGVRHIEANGIGYNQGYTTVEAFFSPAFSWKGCYFPFLDLRGHIFNNGKPASNLGMGMRYMGSSRIWGMNTYYDYRKTDHQSYHQIALGLESLGEIWDFRINGYLPVGNKTSSLFGNLHFDQFKGHHAYFSRKYEFALKGMSGEVGAHINIFKNAPLYIALGPYCLQGKGKSFWGGQLRLAFDILKYVHLEGNTSYDHTFKWVGQGQVSVMIPFGKKRPVKQRKEESCRQDMVLARRALQRVDRREIIPVDQQRKSMIAKDPLTGQPYLFWFVDNRGNSNGTMESPFPTLLQAQSASQVGDIIYVFPGNGTASGMSQGFVLKDHQRILGSAVAHTLSTKYGILVIPAQSSQFPLIRNTVSGSTIIALGNSCEVAGLHLDGSTTNTNGIVGGAPLDNDSTPGVNHILVQSNIIDGVNGTGTGIRLNNCQGNISILNNVLSATGNQAASIEINDGPLFPQVNANVRIENNQVTQVGSRSAVALVHEASGVVTGTIGKNLILSTDLAIFAGQLQTAALGNVFCCTIDGNNCSGSTSYQQVKYRTLTEANMSNVVVISNNTLSGTCWVVQETGSGTLCTRFINNSAYGFTITNDTAPLLVSLETPNGMLNGLQSINSLATPPANPSGTIDYISLGSCICPGSLANPGSPHYTSFGAWVRGWFTKPSCNCPRK